MKKETTSQRVRRDFQTSHCLVSSCCWMNYGTCLGSVWKNWRNPMISMLCWVSGMNFALQILCCVWFVLFVVGYCWVLSSANDDFFFSPVLQPAVEAFFLVHATERESKPPVRDTRESQLSHIKDEPPPLSPAPLTPATPSSLDPFFSREPSSMHISSNLPPDTQKFLRFAGEPERLNQEWLRFVLMSSTDSHSSYIF